MEDQWLCLSTTCGFGVKDSQVHGRYKTRMQPQRLSAGVLNHSSGRGKAKTPMENLCGVGCLEKSGEVALLLVYLCCKCTEVPRAGLLPGKKI